MIFDNGLCISREGTEYHLEFGVAMPRVHFEGLFVLVSGLREPHSLSLNLESEDGPPAEALEAMELHRKELDFTPTYSAGRSPYDPLFLENGWTFLQRKEGLSMPVCDNSRISAIKPKLLDPDYPH